MTTTTEPPRPCGLYEVHADGGQPTLLEILPHNYDPEPFQYDHIVGDLLLLDLNEHPLTYEDYYGSVETWGMDSAVMAWLDEHHGTDLSLARTGGNCTAWQANGLVEGVPAYIMITDNDAQAPVIGWSRCAVVGVYVGESDRETFTEYVGDDTEQLSSPYVTAGQISDLVARAITATGFTPTPYLI